MQYATLADLVAAFGQDEFIQLTDPEHRQTIDQKRVERALEQAQSLCDGKLAIIYQLPLQGCIKPAPTTANPHATVTVPPPALTRLCCDIARYYLHDTGDEDTRVVQAFTRATKELDQIAAGAMQLVCPWGGEAGALRNSAPQSGQSNMTFAGRYENGFLEDAQAYYR